MGIRLRKSIKFGPLSVNLSKSGIGFSVGTKKGYRFTQMANGRRRQTFFIPGTGVSYVKDMPSKKSDKSNGVAEDGSMFTLSWKNAGMVIGAIAIAVIVGSYVMKQAGIEIDWKSVLDMIKKM